MKDSFLFSGNDYEIRCRLFGFYVAYWTSPKGILKSNFLTLYDVLYHLGLPWNLDVSWTIFKHYKLIGRSAQYMGV